MISRRAKATKVVAKGKIKSMMAPVAKERRMEVRRPTRSAKAPVGISRRLVVRSWRLRRVATWVKLR